MTYTPYLVANYRQGLARNVEPWLAPGEASVECSNLYLKNGVYKKRPAQRVFGQLGDLFTFQAKQISGNIYGNPDSAYAGMVLPIVPFSVKIFDDADILVYDSGNGKFGSAFVATDGVNQIDYDTGAFQIELSDTVTGNVHVEMHLAVTQPVRMLCEYKRTDDTDYLCALSTNKLSVYRSVRPFFQNVKNQAGTSTLFNSKELASFVTYLDYLWICDNSVLTSGIGGVKCFDGSFVTDPDLTLGTVGSTTYSITASKLVFVYKERLLLLSTVEGPQSHRYGQRARWSKPGVLPTDTNGWLDPELSGQFGYGGRNDAPTNEAIVTANFIGDTLLVGFTNSIWALESTPSPELPFTWRKIASGKKLIGPQGAISLDDAVMFPSQNGLLACDGNRTKRIDENIPDFVYDITQSFTDKIFSYRDDTHQSIYLACPTQDAEENNKILIFNYFDNAWSTFDVPATCICGFLQDEGKTFNDYYDRTFDDLATLKWGDSTLQSGYPTVLLGQTSGYIYYFSQEFGLDELSWRQRRELDPLVPFNFNYISKRFNPFIDQGQRVQLGYVEILADRFTEGAITANFMLGNDTDPTHSQQLTLDDRVDGTRSWVRADCFLQSDFIQLQLTMSDDQLHSAAGEQPINIHGQAYYFRAMGKFA